MTVCSIPPRVSDTVCYESLLWACCEHAGRWGAHRPLGIVLIQEPYGAGVEAGDRTQRRHLGYMYTIYSILSACQPYSTQCSYAAIYKD